MDEIVRFARENARHLVVAFVAGVLAYALTKDAVQAGYGVITLVAAVGAFMASRALWK